MSVAREHAVAIWRAAVTAADPFQRIGEVLAGGASLLAQFTEFASATSKIWVFGGGKAGRIMAEAVEAALADQLDRLQGIVNVPAEFDGELARLSLRAGRPVGSNHPTVEGVRATEAQLELVERVRPGDLALCLFSGGGSALLPAPVEGVSLHDKQHVTQLLHACGASIDEMNCVRKHLSRYKGGRLGERLVARGCRVVSLLVSDVIGDPLDVIASGPTAADPTTFADALAVLERYQLVKQTPHAVLEHLQRGVAGEIPETPKYISQQIQNIVLCNNAHSLAAASAKAESLGYRVLNLGSFLDGETRHVAAVHAALVRSIRRDAVPGAPPICLLSGGETTVTLGSTPGKGGRNQEFVLACLLKLVGEKNFVVLSAGTDGEDGPTDAAGAIVDASTWDRVGHRQPREYLDRHDAYSFFEATGDLFKTGLTNTNVMDVRVLLIDAL